MPADIALRRLRWLQALQQWREAGRQGTYRHFSLFAAGSTKGIPGADLDWLEQQVELAAFGIQAHQPLLYLRAPLRLSLHPPLDLRAIPDLIGLSPGSLRQATAIDGEIGSWRLIENRSLFEQIAALDGDRQGVVWLPGFPPGWWREVLDRLLRLRPAPVLIACDPDPAGIRIALEAGAVCATAGCPWRPWGMSPDDLDSLPAQLPLEAVDHRLLDGLATESLPATLADLARHLRERGHKGEQEGLPLDRLRADDATSPLQSAPSQAPD